MQCVEHQQQNDQSEDEQTRLMSVCAEFVGGMGSELLVEELAERKQAATRLSRTPRSREDTQEELVCHTALDLLFKKEEPPNELDALMKDQLGSSGCYKRQKHNEMRYMHRIHVLEQEIERLESQLAMGPVSDVVQQVRDLGVEQVQMCCRVNFLRDKWHKHNMWLNKLRKLLAHAPLAEYAFAKAHFGHHLHSNDKPVEVDIKADQQAEDYTLIDGWMASCKEFSAQIVSERLKLDTERSANNNAAALLRTCRDGSVSFDFQFESYGWQNATKAIENSKAGACTILFTCQRVLPVVPGATFKHETGSKSVLKAAALDLWSSFQQEEVFRVYCPAQEDVSTIYEDETHALVKRVFRFEDLRDQLEVVTTECIGPVFDDERSKNSASNALPSAWRIAIQTADDSYLQAVAASSAKLPRSRAASNELPFIVPDLFGPAKPTTSTTDKVSAAQVGECLVGVELELMSDTEIEVRAAGKVQLDQGNLMLTHSTQLARGLLQHFTTFLPVFEANHLSRWLNEAEAGSANEE